MNKYTNILSLARTTLKKISNNKEEWTNYLKTSSRLYKYPFDEQLLIYAQRPNATACASIEIWNSIMNSWVKRGSKGIALIDKNSDKPRLKYVFDLADIEKLKGVGKEPYLWTMQDEHKEVIMKQLEKQYGHSRNDSFENYIFDLSKHIVNDNYHDYLDILIEMRENSFLEEIDTLNVRVMFRNLLSSSLACSLLYRCGFDIDINNDLLDFDNLVNFNTVETITQLGNATTNMAKPILMEIGRIIKSYDNEKVKKELVNDVNINYNTLKRESEDDELYIIEKRGNDDEHNISKERGLSDAEYNNGQSIGKINREIRSNEKEILNGAQKWSISESITDEQIDESFNRNKRRSNEENGIDRGTNETGTDSQREIEGTESDGMGSQNEQYTLFSRGNNFEGTYTQLTLFPTIQQQKDAIEIGANNDAPIFAVKDSSVKKYTYLNPKLEKNIPYDYIINALKRGSENGKILEFYKLDINAAERAKLIKKEYGSSGCSWPIDGFGLHGYDSSKSRVGLRLQWKDIEGEKEGYITWQSIEKEIGKLISENKYISEDELKRYTEIEIEKTKEKLDPISQYDNYKEIILDYVKKILSENEITDVEIIGIELYGSRTKGYSSPESDLDVLIEFKSENFKEDNLFNLFKEVPFEIDGIQVDINPITANESGTINEYLNRVDEYEKDKLSFLLDTGQYFEIHITDKGYDYTFYDSEMHILDGGIFTLEGKKDDTNILEAAKEIINDQYGNISYSVTDIEIIENTDTIFETGEINNFSDSLMKSDSLNKNPDVSDNLTSINPPNLNKNKDSSTNFKLSNDNIGIGTPKEKYKNNINAIIALKNIEHEQRIATVSEQEILSKYVGWGGLSQAFDEHNSSWSKEYQELKKLLSEEEYKSARGSTLNAHYTSPTIIRPIYNTFEKMGFRKGNILEPAVGVGYFFGMLPESMQNSKLYGVELDDLTGRIAKQLYPTANIKICGFEKTDYPNEFFDIAIGNVPFGQYKVSDRNYDKNNFLIHDYFFAKTLDKVRPGGVVAFITSKGTLDKQNNEVRKYLAQRADLLGAVRLPNNAFLANAGTEVTSDIIFLKKRDRVIDTVPNWVHLSKDNNGLTINEYFVDHPEMIVGKMELVSGPYGLETTCQSIDDIPFEEQLKRALSNINGQMENVDKIELDDNENDCISADPSVKNYSFTVADEKVYFRENSIMRLVDLPETTIDRIKGMVEIRNCTNELINFQLEEYSNEEILSKQKELNKLYDDFSNQFGLINSKSNKRVFNQDSSYCLLCSLEILNEDGTLKGKADMFTKRTIKRREVITSVDTSSEALALSLGEKAKIDLEYMSSLTGKSIDDIIKNLEGVIFKNPITEKWETSDEYLSGNVREKLNTAKTYAESHPEYKINVVTLEKVQPKQLDASEIEVRLGATWIDPKYVDDFMVEIFKTPNYLLKRDIVRTQYSNITGQWNIQGKNADRGNVLTYMTYGTSRANAYKILEDSLNLRDVRIFDIVIEDGKEKRVLNKKETMLVSQKQESIRETFKDWIFKDSDRREILCKKYNEIFNSTKPREYDGSHLKFPGMTPDIELDTHQKNAVARKLYGGNTLYAHCVGAGKTFTMTAAAMESKRLGLCQKSLFVVPNHLTEQWASDFLRLYPGANILAATKKDFEPVNRKKFCSRIATGDYEAIIIGHTQFEKIPLSIERQRNIIEKQIEEIVLAINSTKEQNGERYTIKQMEKTKKSLEVRLDKLNDTSKKDDVVTFEQLGVDRIFVDESHSFKNLFLYTKMRNVSGISQTEAQKSSDMFSKCQYMDELTGGKGVTFATGTPISNSMTELYTNMRYLLYQTLQRLGLTHFDSWASTFGETVTAIELAPEGTGYRAKTRFAKFFNLPELINLFKECADIQTADMLKLPIPEVEYHNIVLKPSEHQKEIVSSLAERAESVRNNSVEPSIDNMLKITNDGRKLALDQRLINPLLPDEENSKASICTKNVYQIWENSKEEKSTQLIFCDLSTPKKMPKGYTDKTIVYDTIEIGGKYQQTKETRPFKNIYDDIKEKLIKKGIPEKEIAFIHDANTELQKAELFSKVRRGIVRVLLGSTAKMGAGTNVQDKLIASHHLDVPWRPSDIEQQEGRILRQGNENEKVDIFRYVTEGTFDSYSWQLIENKQKFIGQIMTSKSPVRSCEDIDETALSYAEVKALATGNPYIKEKMDLDIQVSKLKLLKSNYISQIYTLEDNITKHYPVAIKETESIISSVKKDIELYNKFKSKDFSMIVNEKVFYEKKDAGNEIIALCKDIKTQDSLINIGEYCNFSMNLKFEMFSKSFELQLRNSLTHKLEIGSDPLGNITRIDNCLEGMSSKLEKYLEKLETLNSQLDSAKSEVDKPFLQEDELSTKLERLNELNQLLNMDSTSQSDISKKEEITSNIKSSGFKPTDKLIKNIMELSESHGKTLTVKDIKDLSVNSDNSIESNSSNLIDEIVKELRSQEIKSLNNHYDLEL